jgi:hypothetical protein
MRLSVFSQDFIQVATWDLAHSAPLNGNFLATFFRIAIHNYIHTSVDVKKAQWRIKQEHKLCNRNWLTA